MKHSALSALLLFNLSVFSQLTDGTVAPDFNLTDYYGNPHHLYSYLDSGKTVFVEIFVAHCPSCWNYHQTQRLKYMYNMYGPDGTDEVMVLALEHDQYNDSNAFTGNHQPWVTQGDWLTGTPYPIFNVEYPDRGVFSDYNVHGYPVIYKICPNKIVERVYTSTSETQLYKKVQGCNGLSIKENIDDWKMFYNHSSRQVVIEGYDKIESRTIRDLQGKTIQSIYSFSNANLSAESFAKGFYLFEFKTNTTTVVRKIYIY